MKYLHYYLKKKWSELWEYQIEKGSGQREKQRWRLGCRNLPCILNKQYKDQCNCRKQEEWECQEIHQKVTCVCRVRGHVGNTFLLWVTGELIECFEQRSFISVLSWFYCQLLWKHTMESEASCVCERGGQNKEF